MKKLLILGLLVLGLSSCGQSLDTTDYSGEDGEEVTVGTLDSKVEDIQDCLNGDREACKRAVDAGFSNAPFFFEDLQEANSITISGHRFNYLSSGNGFVKFKKEYIASQFNAGTYVLTIKHVITIHDDHTVDIAAWWKYTFQNSWKLENLVPGSNAGFVAAFQGFVNELGLEWMAIDGTHFYIQNKKVTIK